MAHFLNLCPIYGTTILLLPGGAIILARKRYYLSPQDHRRPHAVHHIPGQQQTVKNHNHYRPPEGCPEMLPGCHNGDQDKQHQDRQLVGNKEGRAQQQVRHERVGLTGGAEPGVPMEGDGQVDEVEGGNSRQEDVESAAGGGKRK